jgi:hypothetical protein
MIAMGRLPEPRNPYDKKAKPQPKPRARRAKVEVSADNDILGADDGTFSFGNTPFEE